jgi:hypothetical protein
MSIFPTLVQDAVINVPDSDAFKNLKVGDQFMM